MREASVAQTADTQKQALSDYSIMPASTPSVVLARFRGWSARVRSRTPLEGALRGQT